MDLFSWVIYPSEYRYLTTVFGCKRNPTLETLSLLHLYTRSFNRYPNVDEFLLFVTKECEQECEFYIPLHDLIHITRYSLIEYGFIVKCRVSHYFHTFRVFEHRYPTLTEIYQYLHSERQDDTIITQLMQRDTEEYWEKKQSGLSEQDIYKFVQRNEEKDVMCCVCQEPIYENELIIKLGCNHIFHRGSAYQLAPEDRTETPAHQSDCQGVEEWLKRSTACPICRVSIKEV